MWCAPDLITLQTFFFLNSFCCFGTLLLFVNKKKALFTYALRPCLIYDRGCIELMRITTHTTHHLISLDHTCFGCNRSALHHLVIDIGRLWCEMHTIKVHALLVHTHTLIKTTDRIEIMAETFDHGPGARISFNDIGPWEICSIVKETQITTRVIDQRHWWPINYVQNASSERCNQKESEILSDKEIIVVANGQHTFLNSEQNRCGTRTKLTH